jgi:micrococcal nuclease
LAAPNLNATLMGVRMLALALLLVFPLACGGTHGGARTGTVARVLDGDTIVLEDGRHVRLVQLDAPETDEHECYAQAATRVLARLVPVGSEVEIETDPALDKVDRFGRTLAYVQKDGANINLELVREGAAAPWFYQGDRGRYATQLLQAAGKARREELGLWGACPGTTLDPLHSIDARP